MSKEKDRDGDYMTPAEVAERFRCSRRTVYRYIASGRIPARKPFKTWLIKRSDLDALVSDEEAARTQ